MVYTEAERKKLEEIAQKNQQQKKGLVSQIEDKKRPKRLDPIEFEMNKQLLTRIQSVKGAVSQSQLMSPMRKSIG